MKELRDHEVGHLVVDRLAKEDHPLAEQAGVDVERALAARVLLDDHGHKGHDYSFRSPAASQSSTALRAKRHSSPILRPGSSPLCARASTEGSSVWSSSATSASVITSGSSLGRNECCPTTRESSTASMVTVRRLPLRRWRLARALGEPGST